MGRSNGIFNERTSPMHNGSITPNGARFDAQSLHNNERFTFHSRSAAVHWLWLRNELYGSLAFRGKLPADYRGPLVNDFVAGGN
jgi:hypothetical protein